MGLLHEEVTERVIEDGKRVVFTLTVETSDYHKDNDEGCYTCWIEALDSDQKVFDQYYRLFLVRKFHERHYNNFIKKFVKDPEYRDQFHIRHESRDSRTDGYIDDELQDVIQDLNNIGLVTQYCCQGTGTPWNDRPHHRDGHSLFAYISFERALPMCFRNTYFYKVRY